VTAQGRHPTTRVRFDAVHGATGDIDHRRSEWSHVSNARVSALASEDVPVD
jgi:hypothetical protein